MKPCGGTTEFIASRRDGLAVGHLTRARRPVPRPGRAPKGACQVILWTRRRSNRYTSAKSTIGTSTSKEARWSELAGRGGDQEFVCPSGSMEIGRRSLSVQQPSQGYVSSRR